ncbi:hypothetical protein A6R68_10709, partial [Neotoma lepida]
MKTGGFLLQGFIQGRAWRTAGETPELTLEQPPQDASTKKLSECLSLIGDDLDSIMELQRTIADVNMDPPPFTHPGSSSMWKLTCLLIATSAGASVQANQNHLGLTLDFLQEWLLVWIQDQGGWNSLLSYFRIPTWQTVATFVSGVVTASLTYLEEDGLTLPAALD